MTEEQYRHSALVVVAWAAKRSGAYALGFASLPFVFVIWSAVRFEPPWTSFGTTVVGLYLATLIGLGYAGLAPPRDLGSTTILIAFLCMVSAAPQIVAAAAHENRVASVRALRRATVDRLTGLANRPAFEDRAKDAIRRHPQETMAMAYLDLDQFKLVNDTLSHGTGDELLRSLAAALSSVVRKKDLLARLGGDEFALLLREVDGVEAARIAQELRRVVADFRFALLDEVDSITMASTKAANLFLCGEILDIAGAVGGYNLQAAFSTGYVAGDGFQAVRLPYDGNELAMIAILPDPGTLADPARALAWQSMGFGFAELGTVLVFPIGVMLGMTEREAASVAMIGGADGPMVLFTSLMLAKDLFVPITVVGYLYLGLTYGGYPYLIKLLIPKRDRKSTRLNSSH